MTLLLSSSVAKILPPRVSGKPHGAVPLGVFPPHSGVKSFTTSLRSGNVPLNTVLRRLFTINTPTYHIITYLF